MKEPHISEPELNATLRRLWANRENRHTMRRVLRELVHGYAPSWSDEEVFRQMRLLMLRQAGGLRVRTASYEPFTSTLAGALSEPEPEPARRHLGQEQAPVAEHWIVIELVGEDDMPIPGARYEVTLPDGTVRRGSLNADGRARIEDIEEPGMAQVSFVDLDQDAWEPID